jgi:hypothetical protein
VCEAVEALKQLLPVMLQMGLLLQLKQDEVEAST